MTAFILTLCIIGGYKLSRPVVAAARAFGFNV